LREERQSPLAALRKVIANIVVFCRGRRGLSPLALRLRQAPAALDLMEYCRRLPGPPVRLFNDFLYHLAVGGALETPLRRQITTGCRMTSIATRSKPIIPGWRAR
jgi:hypothetical protein